MIQNRGKTNFLNRKCKLKKKESLHDKVRSSGKNNILRHIFWSFIPFLVNLKRILETS